MMQCKAKSENLAHILGYQFWAVTVAAYVEEDTEEARQDGLDILEEERELALQRSAIYQQDQRRYKRRRMRN